MGKTVFIGCQRLANVCFTAWALVGIFIASALKRERLEGRKEEDRRLGGIQPFFTKSFSHYLRCYTSNGTVSVSFTVHRWFQQLNASLKLKLSIRLFSSTSSSSEGEKSRYFLILCKAWSWSLLGDGNSRKANLLNEKKSSTKAQVFAKFRKNSVQV